MHLVERCSSAADGETVVGAAGPADLRGAIAGADIAGAHCEIDIHVLAGPVDHALDRVRARVLGAKIIQRQIDHLRAVRNVEPDAIEHDAVVAE